MRYPEFSHLVGRGGWVAFRGRGFPTALVRFHPDEDGRLLAVGIHLEDGEVEVTGARVRAFPLAQVTALVQSPDVRDEVLEGLHDTGRDEWGMSPIDRLIVVIGELVEEWGSQPERRALRRQEITSGDAFYEEVARQYRLRTLESRSPASDLAEESGVPVNTVHRWISEARRRGFLPAGRRGRIG